MNLWDYSPLHKRLRWTFGTANTIILNNGKIVVDEPSVVALDRRNRQDDCRRRTG